MTLKKMFPSLIQVIKEVFSPVDENHRLVITYTNTREYEGMIDVDTEKFVITQEKIKLN